MAHRLTLRSVDKVVRFLQLPGKHEINWTVEIHKRDQLILSRVDFGVYCASRLDQISAGAVHVCRCDFIIFILAASFELTLDQH